MVGKFERFTVLVMQSPCVLQLIPEKMLFWVLVAGLETGINFCSSPMDTYPPGVLCA